MGYVAWQQRDYVSTVFTQKSAALHCLETLFPPVRLFTPNDSYA